MAHYSGFRGVTSGIGSSSKADPLGSAFKFDPNASKYGGMTSNSNSPMAFYTPGRVAPTNSLRGVSSGPGITTTTNNLANSGNVSMLNPTRASGYTNQNYVSGLTQGTYSPSSAGPVLGNRKLLDANPIITQTNLANSPNPGIDYKSRFGKETHSLQGGYKPSPSYANPLGSTLGQNQGPTVRPMTMSRLSEQQSSPQGLSNETYGQTGGSTANRTSSAQPVNTGYSGTNRWSNQNRYISSNYSSVERRTSSGVADGNRATLGPQANTKLDSSTGFTLSQKAANQVGSGLSITNFNTASKATLPPEHTNIGHGMDDSQSAHGFIASEHTPASSAAKYYPSFSRNQGMERASKTGGSWSTKKDLNPVQPFEESK
jgi:hypothetical protein